MNNCSAMWPSRSCPLDCSPILPAAIVFAREALALGRLNHPNIAMAFDFGEQNGVDYLVSEYIAGLTLDEKIAERPLLQATVLELGFS